MCNGVIKFSLTSSAGSPDSSTPKKPTRAATKQAASIMLAVRA